MSLRSAIPLFAFFSLVSACLGDPPSTPDAPSTLASSLPAASATATEVFADFEGGTYVGWTLEGDAFGMAPATDALFPGQITGFRGRGFLCSLHPKKGNSATGKANSREFTIEKPVIRFKIGGGNHPNEACLNLVVDNQIVRTATGDDTPTLSDASWDVSALVGKTAHLEVVDNSTSAERGYILVDDIRFTGRIDFDNLPYQQTVKQMADSWISKYHLPGVWCAYIKDGKVVACVADGMKNIETHEPSTINDHLNIGSVTKTITGSLISLFVAKGVISYDTKIKEVFPELANQYSKSPLIEANLRQLMTHTAGLPEYPKYGSAETSGPAYRLDELKMSLQDNRVSVPGQHYVYSYGANLAVAMVEKMTGSTYESWLYGNYGKAFGIVDPHQLNRDKDEVYPYYIEDGVVTPGQLRRGGVAFDAAGSCSLTLDDLCSYAQSIITNSAELPLDVESHVIMNTG